MLFSKYKIILLFALVFSFGFSAQSIFGQPPTPTPCSIKDSIKDSNCPNGIGVGDIKVFDNRSLTLQLEGLEKILQQINVIDQKSLSDSLGLRQGSQSSDVSRSLEIGTPPIPGVTTTRKPDANGDLNISEETTTKKEISATSPILPDALTPPKDEAKFGTQSENLLQQQIDLTYKIFNLRMLLERSLTDRLASTSGSISKSISSSRFNSIGGELVITENGHKFSTGFEGRFTTTGMLPNGLTKDEDYYVIRVDANTFKLARSFTDALQGQAIPFGDQGTGTHTFTSRDGGSKLQTVLGFNVSLDPQKVAKDMAAFVELTVTTSDGTPVSVVSLMPEEKTYNTSALSTKSNAFGGSAVFKVISVGYSERRRGQTYYLYQDADTLTYRKPTEDGSLSNVKPTFGWEFRPVLGRRSVANDPRNLFVVLSVDKRDLVDIPESTTLQVKVKTYWKKYDHKTQTIDSAELYARNLSPVNASVFSTAKYQAKLSPNITNVKWNQLDEKNGVISIEGENFFTGTSVLIGNTVLDNPTNGLTIKSDQSLQIRTTLDAISSGDVVFNGRYGNSQTIFFTNQSPNVKGIAIEKLIVESLSDKTSRLQIQLRNTDLDNLTLTEIINPSNGQLTPDNITKFGVTPIVRIGNTGFSVRNQPQSINCPVTYYLPDGSKLGNDGKSLKIDDSNLLQKNCVLVTVDIPTNLVNQDTVVSFKIPLLGQKFAPEVQLYYGPQPSNVKLTKLSDDVGKSTFSITGNELDKLTITNALITPSLRNNKLITFDLTDAQIKLVKNIILLTANNEPIVLEIPDSLPKPPKPTLTNADIPQVSINSSKTVTFNGEGLDQITKAFFEDKELQIVKKSKTEIIVLLTRDVTKEAGDVEIILKKDINDKEPVIGKVLILDKSKETKP